MNSLASIYAEALMWWQTHPHIPLATVEWWINNTVRSWSFDPAPEPPSLADVHAEAMNWYRFRTSLARVLSERDATAKILLTKDDNGS